ncbi:MAG: Na/Pi cotransporter family protein [Kiritimatiellae bacterium]|nr:Na/Pi cotransporter family protein [Kiritimatiellia bacterium]
MQLTFSQTFFLISAVLGGLALFLFGMSQMSQGLKAAAGPSMRTLLTRATSNRFKGLLLGTVLGTMIHSSAATVMTVGFVNAGLMTLAQSISVILGANLGTSLSMQIVSLHLTDYSFFAIALGFFIWMGGPSEKLKSFGQAMFGFGLLFLGLGTMGDALVPHRDQLQPLLSFIDGSTWKGMLLGIAVATGVTAIIQSSGATIGMCYSLAATGVFTNLEQCFPVVMGAQIGTCATALLGSIGTNVEARRAAIGHLLFNILNVGAALLIAPWLIELTRMTSTDLIHQTANLHTLIKLLAAVAFLPFIGPYTKLLRILLPSRKALPESSYLEESLIPLPEQAIQASILELRRVTRICMQSLVINGSIIFENNRGLIRRIRQNEIAIDEIKLSFRNYLREMTDRYLSRRQAIMIQHLDRAIIDLERIGDHIDSICDISIRRRNQPEAQFTKEGLDCLFTIFRSAEAVVSLVIESLDPKVEKFQELAEKILKARDQHIEVSMEARAKFMEKVESHEYTSLVGMYFNEYATAFDRIVRHSKMIALMEKQPDFWIKRKKLTRIAPEQKHPAPPEKAQPKDYLDQLKTENYL